MNNSRVVLFYLLMLVGHVVHFLEEIWGRFWLMNAFFGLGWFLIANWVLVCIPVVIFFFVLREKRWASYLGMLYAGIMTLNGVGHNIATIVTGRYFDGFAGGYTGIGLLLIGPPMIYHLRKGIPAD